LIALLDLTVRLMQLYLLHVQRVHIRTRQSCFQYLSVQTALLVSSVTQPMPLTSMLTPALLESIATPEQFSQPTALRELIETLQVHVISLTV